MSEAEQERLDRFAAAALTGVLANPEFMRDYNERLLLGDEFAGDAADLALNTALWMVEKLDDYRRRHPNPEFEK